MEELAEPTLVQALRPHRGEVTCVDARGAWLVSGGGDRALRLWRWASGAGWQEAGAAPAAHRYGVTAARWAGAGVLLASAGVDGNVRVWCGRTLAPRRLLAAPGAAAARALCWAGGAARLLAGHDDGALCVWGVTRGVLLARLVAHEGSLHAVATPARGALLLTACTHGVLKVFDLAEVCESGEGEGPPPSPLLWLDGAHDLGALCADASEEGTSAATGGHDALVRVWRVSEGGGRGAGGRSVQAWGAPLEGHAAAVTALRWARGVLASASLDRTARLWLPERGACLRVVNAHPRYLTCVALAPDLTYLITGSNDKSVRTWSLGELTLEGELEPACAALAHFALGDLEGIGPVDEDCAPADAVPAGQGAEGEGARAVARLQAHAGALNCVAVHEQLVATASSDGAVKTFRWEPGEGALVPEHALAAHEYPALAVDFGGDGQVLLSAGLDGCACVWDVQTGVQLRCVLVPSGGGVGGEAGGGGVRGARLSPHRPPLLLLATDDGLAPLWSLTAASPAPAHVFSGHTEAVTCCAWSPDGRVAATGAASGELRLLVPPPLAATLHHESVAHDLGVQSCDFAPPSTSFESDYRTYLLATGGCDSLLKLWTIDLAETGETASVRCVRQWEAHGGGATSVRWGAGAAGSLLASAGADRWARVWRVAGRGARVSPHAAVCVEGGALSVALLALEPDAGQALAESDPLLVVGTLGGELALWRVPAVEPAEREDDEGAAPRAWTVPSVLRWLREYVTRAPGSPMGRDREAELLQRARDLCITGTLLLDEPLERLLGDLGYGEESGDVTDDSTERTKEELERVATRDLLRTELLWLRRPPPPHQLAVSAPHSLLCPLTHRLLWEPAHAADGFTYDRAAILEWFLAAGGAVSPVSGRQLRNARVVPNYAVRDQLRTFLEQPLH